MVNSSFNLSDLNGANGFAINGIKVYDYSGVSVSSAGDVNGDGIDDLIIGAEGASFNGDESGQSYVVFGKSTGFSLTAVGVDTISDFNCCQGDKIVLDKTTFSAITSDAGTGFSNKSDFQVTNLAGTSTAKIVYDAVSGQLFYNENGDAAGFGSGGLFATLTGAPTLTASNFVLQA